MLRELPPAVGGCNELGDETEDSLYHVWIEH